MLDPVPCPIQPMVLEMSHRELLKAGSTLQTRYDIFGDTFPPIDGLLGCLWCSNSNATLCLFLGFEGLQTGIGLLEGLVHVLW